MKNAENRNAQMPDEPVMRAAILDRDPGFDGTFVYGVLTTGVYCRPSCASRAANPANVRFFRDAATAESAGLRPCKRCDPRGAGDRHIALMQELARYIEKHADKPLSLKTLAEQAQLSPAYLQRVFKRALGVSPIMRNLFATLGAGLQTILGGNITLLTQLCEKTRQDAFIMMMEHAAEHGANAVIMARYDANELMQGVTEVLAYGTAVVVEKV